jgi:hypothetical protein
MNLNDKAKAVAVGEYLSSYPDDLTAQEAFDIFTDADECPEDFDVWEAHECRWFEHQRHGMETLYESVLNIFGKEYTVFVKAENDSQFGEGWTETVMAENATQAVEYAILSIKRAIEQPDAELVGKILGD